MCVSFLKIGGTHATGAYGPMSEVVAVSTSHLDDSDLLAIATYLKSLGAAEATQPETPEDAVMATGKAIFDAQCAACHTTDGDGVASTFASLKGNPVVQSSDPASVIHAVLTGLRAVSARDRPTGQVIPAFDWKLTDAQIAAVATYIRNSWGNAAPAVSAGDVSDLRHAMGAKPHLAASR